MTAGDSKGPRRFTEALYDGVGFSFEADRIIFEDATDHQHLVLFENKQFGKVLMLDGVTQVTTADEFIYHEMMAHVPILAHGEARRVLIVGGGDCGIAEEVLKHNTVARLVQVEIDAAVLDFAKAHFSEFNAPVFSDARFECVIADGMKFVAETAERFDVIIVDSTDPIGPGEVLFSQAFYDHCHRLLTARGIMVTQNGVPFMQSQELLTSIARFSKLYADAAAYVAAIPTYIGGHMALGWAAKDKGLRQQGVADIAERFEREGFSTRYYTPEVHVAAFALPRFIAELVAQGRGA